MNDPLMQNMSSPDPIRNSLDSKTPEKSSHAETQPISLNNRSSISNGTGQSRVAPSSPPSSPSLVYYVVVALAFALFVRFFIAAPYMVSGASMEPTFYNLHYLIVDRVTYKLENPSRGDVIVFDLPENPSKSLIKRVIGLPGETVIVKKGVVTIQNDTQPKGFVLEEPYIDPKNLSSMGDTRVTLEEDQYFVMGDNRAVSADSRIWGPLPRENIVGRVLVRLYPFNGISLLPGEARYEE